MSLPNDQITDPAVVGAFLAPLEDWTYTPLQEKVIGGTAIGDGAAGRQVQNWIATYDGTSVNVAPEGGSVEFTLPLADVLTVSLGFDSNMAVAIAYQISEGAKLYYYSALDADYATLTIAGATSCRVSVDDPRLFSSGASDVIFGYVLGDVLYYRQQRDRYLVEYEVGPAAGKTLTKMGMSVMSRFQFQLT